MATEESRARVVGGQIRYVIFVIEAVLFPAPP